MLSELDVINNCLATMGEVPLNELVEDHPMVAAARRYFSQENLRMQKRGWWFNKELIDLYPDPVSHFIYIPMDAIQCDPTERYRHLPWTVRGRRFYDNDKNTYLFEGDKRIECTLIREVPFDDLPPSAQDLVNFRTVLAFQMLYDADPNKSRMLSAQAQEAYTALNTEHIRSIKGNQFMKPDTFNNLMNIGGPAFYRRGRY